MKLSDSFGEFTNKDFTRAEIKLLVSVTIYGYLFIALMLLSASKGFMSWLSGKATAIMDGIRMLGSEQLLQGFAAWGMFNIVLYAIIGIAGGYWIIRHCNNACFDEPDTDVEMTGAACFIHALKHGPAHAPAWMQNSIYDRMVMSYIRKGDMESKIVGAKKFDLILSTYEDMKTGIVSNRLTLKLVLLGALSAFVWGLYPYSRALKRGVCNIAEIALREPGLLQNLSGI